MATKRMLSLKIVDSDAFLDMPQTSQLLYLHLAMRVDDDGFVGNPKKIMRMIGSADNDLTVLFTKKFILGFDSGVIVIKHHRLNNNWDSYNCKRTQYVDEFNQLNIKENGSYTLDKSQGLLAQTEIRLKSDEIKSLEENRIEETRLDKNRIEEVTLKYGEFKNIKLTEEEFNKLIEKLGDKNTSILIEELSSYLKSTGKRYASHYATLLNWARRKIQNHQEKLQTKKRYIA